MADSLDAPNKADLNEVPSDFVICFVVHNAAPSVSDPNLIFIHNAAPSILVLQQLVDNAVPSGFGKCCNPLTTRDNDVSSDSPPPRKS